MLKGSKTYISAAIIGLSAAMKYMGYGEMAEVLLMAGAAGGLAGMRAAMK